MIFPPFLYLLFFFVSFSSTDGIQLIITNNCKETIWPGILATAGHQTPNDGGFRLYPNEQLLIDVPQSWSGRMWARTGCCFDKNSGRGSCQTGDCAGLIHCAGIGGTPPATLVEMTFGTSMSPLHFYDVSLVDGFNIPVAMTPVGGGIGCGVAECETDLNACCPMNLVVKKGGKVLACKSACLAAKSDRDRYCCTGAFGDSTSCKPSVFGRLFKGVCPRAYSYAFDDLNGLKTCRAPRYVITFCPPKW